MSNQTSNTVVQFSTPRQRGQGYVGRYFDGTVAVPNTPVVNPGNYAVVVTHDNGKVIYVDVDPAPMVEVPQREALFFGFIFDEKTTRRDGRTISLGSWRGFKPA